MIESTSALATAGVIAQGREADQLAERITSRNNVFPFNSQLRPDPLPDLWAGVQSAHARVTCYRAGDDPHYRNALAKFEREFAAPESARIIPFKKRRR